MKTRHLLTGLLLGAMATVAMVSQAAEKTLTVFGASSLTNVLEEAGKAYTAKTGAPVRFSFAASSVLAKQVESGAPADVFISADQEWMDYLASRKLIQPATRRDIAGNSLVLVAPADSSVTLKIAPGFALAAALGERGRIATGDPASVPVGKYAKAALGNLKVWGSIENRIIPADNVRTALNFVARGEAPLGIVYATDARAETRVRVVDTFPANTHEPITYPAAATTTGGADAAEFVAFLASEPARAIFDKAGFSRATNGCSLFKWDVSREVALYSGDSRVVAAGASDTEAPRLETGRLYALDLKPQESVRYAAPASKKQLPDGAFGGVMRLRVQAAGQYRIAIDSGFWLDVVQQGKTLAAADFNGSATCAGPRKIVVYDLPANVDLLLQVSASSDARARMTVTAIGAARP